MTFATLSAQSQKELLQHLAAAVRNDNHEEFCLQTQMGVAYFDQEAVASIINEKLPLILDVKYIPRLLQFMTGDDYIDTVRSFLAELIKVLATEGFVLGKDFSYGESDDVPYLTMTNATALQIENVYEPHAWKQTLPYLHIQ